MTTSESTPRIPAWKRIGLKLKYAKDSPDDPAPVATANDVANDKPAVVNNHKKRSFDQEAPETPAKRPKSATSRANHSEVFPAKQSYGQQHSTGAPEESERSSLPAPVGVFKAPNQTPKRIVFGEDE